VTRLHDNIRSRIASPSFHAEMIDKLSNTYALFIKHGLVISLNGQIAEAHLPEIAMSAGVKPVRKRIRIEKVDVVIIAGIFPDDYPVANAGWYVFCNGRLVIGPDRSSRTGWGDGLPSFHFKYNHFVGYVYFRSDTPSSLPWTTTKRDIDAESPAFRQTLGEMRLQARPILNFLNKLYPAEVLPEDVPERQLLESARGVQVHKLKPQDMAFTVVVPERKKTSMVNILYKKPKKQVDRIRSYIHKPDMSSRGVGEYTFDYYLRKATE